jgi:serine/threonine protein kinase
MTAAKLKGRFEKLEVLGQGGMGIVYKAFDSELRREVALKTILDSQNQTALELFQKECAILAALNHPNIVDIYDIGEFEDAGIKKPYFVMPLLHGMTLDRLIAKQPQRLTPERTVEIMASVCRGLQAAHERGLVHRDMKPSNIFVLEDDSVKVIDFGIAHLIDQHSNSGLKGTPFYMAPEQLQLQTPTALSDIFALGVVCFEALTRRRPFTATSQEEIAMAVLHQVPPSVSDLNPAVNSMLSQVIHAAMAKKPWHRFASAKEFSDALQKALRNQRIERFDPTHTAPRMQKAQKALENSEYEFANEILRELEAEGCLQPEIRSLRQQIDRATRAKMVTQLLLSAKRRFEDEEYQLALAKVGEVLQFDPANPDALELKNHIENKRNSDQIKNWLRIANQHIESNSFNMARQALQNVLRLKPTDSQALIMLSEVDRKEQDYLAIRKEKEQLFQSAEEFWHNGDVSAALSKLERVMDLDRRAPETSAPERASAYQELYNKVRSEHDAIANGYADARKNVADHNYPAAIAICDRYLDKFPGHALFQALKFDIGEHERQDLSAFIAKVDRDIEAEPDLDKRVSILQAAVDKYPGEQHLEQTLRMVASRRDLVNGIAHRARNLEERGQYADALSQMEILRTIYPQYPGLDYESNRLRKRGEDQSRAEVKARTIGQIDRAISGGDYSRALEMVQSALTEFPGDAELAPLERLARQRKERNAEAQRLLEQGQQRFAENDVDNGLEILRQANRLDEHSSVVRAVLVDSLVRRATDLLPQDWRAAEGLGREALDLDPTNAQAKSLRSSIADWKREENVGQILSRARERQAASDLDGALGEVEQGLQAHPRDPRLAQLKETLGDSHRQLGKRQDLDRLKESALHLESEENSTNRDSLMELIHDLAKKHSDDEQFQAVAMEAERSWRTIQPQGNANIAATPEVVQPSATRLFDDPAAKPPLKEGRAERSPSGVPVRVAPAPSGPGLLERARRTAGRVISRCKDSCVRVAQKLGPWAKSVPNVPARLRRPVARWMVIGFLAATGFFLVWIVARHKPRDVAAAAPIVNVPVLIGVTPANAKVLWNGQTVTNNLLEALANTRQEVEVSLLGYRTEKVPVDVKPGMGPVNVSLAPLPQVLRLNVPEGRGMLDKQPVVLNGVPIPLVDGAHRLDLTIEPAGGLQLEFESQPGKMPAVTAIRRFGAWATVVANLGNVSRVYGPPKAGLNGQLQDVNPSSGLELSNPNGGLAELTVFEDGLQRQMPTEFDGAPSLTVTVLDANRAMLVVQSNAEGGLVFIDDRQGKVPIRDGKFQIPLKPGVYRVTVKKEGFQDAQQEVQLAKSKLASIELNPRPVPRFSGLEITSAVEGAEVSIDDKLIGTVPQSGSFETKGIQPGTHRISFRRDYYEPKDVSREFVEGKTILLTKEDTAMLKWAEVDITVKPNVPVRIEYYKRDEKDNREGDTFPVDKGVAHVREGLYHFTVTAEGYEAAWKNSKVKWGQDVPLEFTLTPIPILIKKIESLVLGLNEFERRPIPSSDGWSLYDHDVLFSPKPDGTFAFDTKKNGGLLSKRRKFQIGLGCGGSGCVVVIDPFNDRGAQVLEHGSALRQTPIAPAKKNEEVRVIVTVGEHAYSVRIGPTWHFEHQVNDVNLLDGKFGFLGADIRIKNFQFREAAK